MARLKSHSTPTSNGNTQGDGHAAKGARGDRPAPAIAAADIAKAQLKRKPEKNPVPTRDTSRRTGCRVGSSIISPAATMGIMAVKILVRKVQIDTEKIKTGGWDFPGGPAAETSRSQCKGPRVRPLVRKLDPTCCN